MSKYLASAKPSVTEVWEWCFIGFLPGRSFLYGSSHSIRKDKEGEVPEVPMANDDEAQRQHHASATRNLVSVIRRTTYRGCVSSVVSRPSNLIFTSCNYWCIDISTSAYKIVTDREGIPQSGLRTKRILLQYSCSINIDRDL